MEKTRHDRDDGELIDVTYTYDHSGRQRRITVERGSVDHTIWVRDDGEVIGHYTPVGLVKELTED